MTIERLLYLCKHNQIKIWPKLKILHFFLYLQYLKIVITDITPIKRYSIDNQY